MELHDTNTYTIEETIETESEREREKRSKKKKIQIVTLAWARDDVKIGLYANQAAVQLIQLTGYVTTLMGHGASTQFSLWPLRLFLFIFPFLSYAFYLAVCLFLSKSFFPICLLDVASIRNRSCFAKVFAKWKQIAENASTSAEPKGAIWYILSTGLNRSCIAKSLFTIAIEREPACDKTIGGKKKGSERSKRTE